MILFKKMTNTVLFGILLISFINDLSAQSENLIVNKTENLNYLFADSRHKFTNSLFLEFVSENVTDTLNTFVDKRDNRLYKFVKIREQIWMAENLAYKINNDCWAYKNNEENVMKFGRLYSYEVAKNICPEGWHLPSDEEWKQLERAVGLIEFLVQLGGGRGEHSPALIEGGSSGFNIRFAGVLIGPNKFRAINKNTVFWSSTEFDNLNTWHRSFDKNKPYVFRAYLPKIWGCSVRCIKDN